MKEDTETVKKTAIDYATFPLRLAGEGKEYVLGTFNDEYSKTSGEGVFKLAKATISTELKFTLDAYQVFYQYWTQSKQEGEKSRKEAESKLADGQKKVQAKANEAKEKASN